MKNLFLIGLFLFSFSLSLVHAQDIIVTHDNKFLEVKILSSDSLQTFYKSKKGIKLIATSDIKMMKWNTKKYLKSSGDQKMVFKPELTNQGLYLEKKQNKFHRNAGIATLTSAGLSMMLLSGAKQADNGVDALGIGIIYLGSLGSTLVSGVMYLASFGGDDGYVLKPIDNSLGHTEQSLMNQRLKKSNDQPYLSVSNSGLGLQLNF